MDENNSTIAELTYDFLKRSCYWIVYKYNIDDFHTQQNSSRGDLIGGFIDRWINRIPETLIFNNLLKDNMEGDITVVNDIFLYNDAESKSAPDILGLVKDNEYYPFVKFNNGFWDSQDVDFPFVEMKTFREKQNLITIPNNQFYSNHYYAIVESHINENYLLWLFSDDFLDFRNEFTSNYKELIKHFKLSDDGNQLIMPNKNLEKNKALGYYELLGIYKGNILKKFSITAGKTDDKIDKPRYLKKVELYEYSDEIIQDSGDYEYFSEKRSIPVYFKINNNSKASIINMRDDELTIKVEGNIEINGRDFSSGNYNLMFNNVIYNSIKYYILDDDIINTESPIIDEDINISSGLYFHNPDERSFIEMNIEFIDKNSTLKLLKKNQKDIYLEVDGEINVENYKMKTGMYNIELGYKTNVIKIYHIKKDEENSLCIYDNKNPSNVVENVPLPFTNEYTLNNESYSYEPLKVKMLKKNSRMVIINKNKKNFSIFIRGSVNLNNKPLENGCFYKVNFSAEGNFYKIIDDPEEIENPLFDTNISLDNNKIKTGLYKHYDDEKENNVPVLIQVVGNSNLSIVKKTKGYLIVQVKGEAKIDGYQIHNKNNEGYWILFFESFNRSSEKEEIILSKRAIASSKESSQEELLIEFEKFIESFNK